VPGWDRVESATKSGLGFGALIGAVRGNWDVCISLLWLFPMRKGSSGSAYNNLSVQFSIVKNETSLGALGKSATTMGSTMLMFGSVAFTYAACEAALESFRGEADWKNGAMAGFAAGVVCLWHYTPTILCQPNHRRLVSHAVGYSHSLVLNSSLQDLLSAFAMEALDQSDSSRAARKTRTKTHPLCAFPLKSTALEAALLS